MLVHPDGRIAVKQAWFKSQKMSRAVTALWKNSLVTWRTSDHTREEPTFGCGVFLKEFE